MKKIETPIKIWVIVFVIFIGIQTAVYFYEKKVNPHPLTVPSDEISKIINELKKTDSVPLKKVVIIGSSLVSYGIGNPQQTTISIPTKKGSFIKLTKIWKSDDPYFELVERDSILKKLKEIHPDLICIQTEMVAIDLYRKDKFNYLFTNITDYTYESKLRIYIALDKLNIYKKRNPDVKTQFDTLNYKTKVKTVKKISAIEFAFNDLKELQKEGIKVVILDVPRPKKVEEEIYTPTFNAELQKLLDFYKKEFNIDYWKYTGKPMYYKHFLDGGHLNKNGSEIYTNWLTNKISKELN